MKIMPKLLVLSVGIVLIMTAAVLGGGTFIIDKILYDYHTQILRLELDQTISGVAERLNRSGVRAASEQAAQLLRSLQEEKGFGTLELNVIEALDSRVIYHPNYNRGDKLTSEGLRSMFAGERGNIAYSVNGVDRYAVFGTLNPPGWLFVLSVQRSQLLARRNEFLYVVGGITFAALGLSALSFSLLGGLLVKRVGRALDCVTRIEHGELSARIPVTADRDEIAHLQHGINAMGKRIEERTRQLQESEAKYRRIIDTAYEGVWMIGMDLRTTFVNARMAEMLGYTPGEIVGRFPGDFLPKEDLPDFGRRMERRRRGISESYECRFRRKDGRTLWVRISASPLFDADGKPVGAFSMHTDITARRQAEEELKVINERLALATSAGRMGVWDWDVVNNKLVWDNQMYELYGVKPEDFGGAYEAWVRTVHPDDRARCDKISLEARQGEREYDTEFRVIWPDQSIHHIKAYGQIVRDASGKVVRMTGVNFDITERKRTDEELRQYRDHLEEIVENRTAELLLARDAAEAANKAKSVFLANMSHELRTPLNAVLGFSELMRQEGELTSTQRQRLDIISRSGSHLLTLINDVLEMSKIEAGRMQAEVAAFDLDSMVQEVVQMMRGRAQDKGLRLTLERAPDCPRYIRGDEARLRQVFINLVGNAVKFTREGGVAIRFGVKKNAREHLVIEVEDTGPGISPEDQQRLFQPFIKLTKTGAEAGTGLGLAISRQFMEMMGGTVDVGSTLGKGSVFRIDLPVELASEEEISGLQCVAGPGEVAGLAPGQAVFRTLIAEDQLEGQLLLSKLMTDIGLEVKIAENGREAVRLFEEWHPHLIWMDRRMPVMDGIEATRAIRQLPGGKEVKIVAVTASVFKDQQQEMLDAGMDDFVRKPYRFEEIYESLSRQLGAKYTYRPSAAGPEEEDVPVTLTPDMFAALPDALRVRLRVALLSLDAERISAAIAAIGSTDAGLARTLTRFADDFNYPAILNVLTGPAQAAE